MALSNENEKLLLILSASRRKVFKWKCIKSTNCANDIEKERERERANIRGKWREMPNSHDLFHFNITQKWLNMWANNNLHWRPTIHHSQLKSLNIFHTGTIASIRQSYGTDREREREPPIQCYANITKTNDLFNKRLLLYQNVYIRIIIYHSRTHSHTWFIYSLETNMMASTTASAAPLPSTARTMFACQTSRVIRNSVWGYMCLINVLSKHFLFIGCVC